MLIDGITLYNSLDLSRSIVAWRRARRWWKVRCAVQHQCHQCSERG